MQEKLKIFSLNGDLLLERDLSEESRPLVVLGGETPRIVDVVPPGADVLGALVRDEDGWALASAKSDLPVTAGPKSGADFHLTAGIACSLGPWVFRIEREGTLTGTVLLWRVASSAIVADPLSEGKNVVAATKDGAYAVNPAVPGEELCTVFPTADGVEVVMAADGAQRLAVPFATLFAVGSFHAMALPAAEAAAAVKSGSPFGWPARRTRAGLLAMMLLVGLVCLGVLALVKEKGGVDAALAAKHGAVEVVRHHTNMSDILTDEDTLVYRVSFFRSLPLILTAARSPITRDMILRGEQLIANLGGTTAQKDEKDIKSFIRFLKGVDTIQGAVEKGDWETLKNALAAADRTMFTTCDADKFYEDAKEIDDFVTVVLPKFLSAISEIGAKDIADADRRLRAFFEGMKDNLFMSGDIIRRERDNAHERWRVLSTYIPAREQFLSGADAGGVALQDAWADLTDVFDPDDPAFAPMVTRERKLLMDAILKRAETADSVALIRLCTLGEAVGVADDKLAEWRARAAKARQELAKRYRDLYSDYRMRAAVAPDAAETLAVLDAMVALGLEDNPYHQWALREKERVATKKQEERQKDPNAKQENQEDGK